MSFAQYRKLLKATGAIVLTAGTTWSCYQVYQTYCRVDKLIKTDVLELEKKRAEYIFMNDPIFKEKEGTIMIDEEEVERWTRDIFLYPIKWWQVRQNSYAWRLMHMAQTGEHSDRMRAVQSLAALTDLKASDYQQLAQVCDARTAAGLARSDGTDLRYFLAPPYRHIAITKEELEERFHALLVALNVEDKHECLQYFITRAFPKFYQRYLHWMDDHHSPDHVKQIIRHEDVLTMCVENLLHHSNVRADHAKDIVMLGGLPFLMDLARNFKDDVPVLTMLAKLMSNISMSEDMLENIFFSGWLGVLTAWSRHPDLTLSANASRALANLDEDCHRDGRYARRVHLLHPTSRRQVPPRLDVVFVHGLLGGAFVTWRQRDVPCPTAERRKAWAPATSEPSMASYVEEVALAQAEEWEELMRGYEAVLSDCPEQANGVACGPFTFAGPEADKILRQGSKDSQGQNLCWPKYWLPDDCRYLRVIGINYDTNISSWSTGCEFEKIKRSIEERSNELIVKLKKAGLGSRPIVWVAHSMGGLIVKRVLVNAWESADEETKAFVTNTKAVVFYSTPHVGSPLARLSSTTSLVIMPSVELRELAEKSPALLDLHKKFLSMLQVHPLKIVSFAETKLTEVTSLRIAFNFVPLDSADPGVGEFFAIPQDHLCICKPASRQSFLYQKVLHLINECLAASG